MNQIPFTVIGITPSDFSGVSVGNSPDLWVPLHALDRLKPDSKRWMESFSTWMLIAGRLRPGILREQAQAELDLIHRRFVAEQLSTWQLGSRRKRAALRSRRSSGAPAGRDRHGQQRSAGPLRISLEAPDVRIGHRVTGGVCKHRQPTSGPRFPSAPGDCSKAGSGSQPWTAGAAAYHRKHGSRIGRWLSGNADLVVGEFGTAAHDLDRRCPGTLAVDPDWRIFGFTAVMSLLTGILFGLAPAVRSTRAAPGPVMKEGTRQVGRSSHTLESTLVVAQVALSVILVTGAGLFLRTLQDLWNVNIGYDRENVLMLSVDAKLAGYPSDRAGSIYREILRRLQALPGVKSASASIVRPVDDQFNLLDQVDEIDGRRLPEQSVIRVAWNATGPGYFSTVSTPFISGRDFEPHDDETAPKVVIVSESLANSAFPNQNPIGHRLGAATIVGVVKDSLYSGARDQPRPLLYRPLFQDGPDQEYRWGFVSFELRYGSFCQPYRRSAPGSRFRGPQSGCVPRQNTGRASRTVVDEGATARDALQFLRSSRAAARLRWSLWPDGVCGRAQDRRDWYPGGARRAARSRYVVGPSRDALAHIGRHRSRGTFVFVGCRVRQVGAIRN